MNVVEVKMCAKTLTPNAKTLLAHFNVIARLVMRKLVNHAGYVLQVAFAQGLLTKVIIYNNDPLGQPTVPAGSDFRLILKFWDVRTYGRTLCVKIVITPRLWSALWINLKTTDRGHI